MSPSVIELCNHGRCHFVFLLFLKQTNFRTDGVGGDGDLPGAFQIGLVVSVLAIIKLTGICDVFLFV